MVKRKDGRYAKQLVLGTDISGKKIKKTVYGKTVSEVKAKAAEVKKQYEKGLNAGYGLEPFIFWGERWIEFKKYSIGETTLATYDIYVKRIGELLGDKPIVKIEAMDLQKILNDAATKNPVTQKPSSKRTLSLYKTVMTQVFSFAGKNRAIDYDPSEYLVLPKAKKTPKKRPLTNEEIDLIMRTPHKMRLLAMTMIFAGLRRGEALALTWDDVDAISGTIRVNKAVEFVGETPRVKETKTVNGNRTVFIHPILSAELFRASKSGSGHPAGLIFANKNGEMYTKGAFRSAWKAYMCDLSVVAGDYDTKHHPEFKRVINFTPHMCRHTYCTLLFESGVDVMTAKNQMGHAQISTTLDIYTHLSTDHAKTEMEKFKNFTVGTSENKSNESDAGNKHRK